LLFNGFLEFSKLLDVEGWVSMVWVGWGFADLFASFLYHHGEVVGRVFNTNAQQDGAWIDGVGGLLDALWRFAEWHCVVIKWDFCLRGYQGVCLGCKDKERGGLLEGRSVLGVIKDQGEVDSAACG
jgi:hypothetical protein